MLFQWKCSEDAVAKNAEKMEDELAYIITYAILFAYKTDIYIKEAVIQKLSKNAIKYPVDKSFGSNKKYKEL